MAFQGVLAVVFSPIVARIMTKVDLRALVCFGISLMAVIALWRTHFATNIDFYGVSITNLVQGMAMPFFFIPTTSLALSAVLPQETASAAGLMNFMRTTAGAFGTVTLAVMSRASLGHTGRPLVATFATQACYGLVLIGSVARICSGLGHGPVALLHVAGLCWSLAFLGFALAYWPVLTGARVAPKASPAAQRA